MPARHALAIALVLAVGALSGCTSTRPHAAPTVAPAPVAEGDQPEPATPGIKPLTVEQAEQVGEI